MKLLAASSPPPNQPLDEAFFARPSPVVAAALLGKILRHTLSSGQILSGIIVETEAYLPENDLAAHGSRGLTKLTAPLFQAGGTIYIHPMRHHLCLDIVAATPGVPAGVLIRALQPLEGIEAMHQLRKTTNPFNLASGPGKLCQALAISRALNGLSVTASQLQVLHQPDVATDQIATSQRIGITKSTHLPLRFTLAGSPYLSRR